MRKCCCCSVKNGAVILGFLNFILPLLVFVPLAGYWFSTDGQKELKQLFEDFPKSHSWTAHSAEEAWFISLAVLTTAYAGVTSLFGLFVVLGVSFQSRCLMVPFLILTMVDIILAGAVGIVVVVTLFYNLATIAGVVSAVLYVMVAVVSLYSWAVVLAAYKQLGKETDNKYSPSSHPGETQSPPKILSSCPPTLCTRGVQKPKV